MRFFFSLKSLLVFTGALAIALALAFHYPVQNARFGTPMVGYHMPSGQEAADRLAYYLPLAVFESIGWMWVSRQFQRCRN